MQRYRQRVAVFLQHTYDKNKLKFSKDVKHAQTYPKNVKRSVGLFF